MPSFTLHFHSLNEDIETLDKVERIVFQSDGHQYEILPGHAPLFTIVQQGLIKIVFEQGETKTKTLKRDGFLKFTDSEGNLWIG
jgi:F0F1-type ATP synthase epsilon subunit